MTNAGAFAKLMASSKTTDMMDVTMTTPCTTTPLPQTGWLFRKSSSWLHGRVDHKFESLHAEVDFGQGVDIHPGDEVIVHGQPIFVPYGQTHEEERQRHCGPRNLAGAAVDPLTGDFEFMELCEFSFSEGGDCKDMSVAEETPYVPNETTQAAHESTVLSPRFYTTDFDKLDATDVSNVRAEWDELIAEMRSTRTRTTSCAARMGPDRSDALPRTCARSSRTFSSVR